MGVGPVNPGMEAFHSSMSTVAILLALHIAEPEPATTVKSQKLQTTCTNPM
jgi:hypothetical protein